MVRPELQRFIQERNGGPTAELPLTLDDLLPHGRPEQHRVLSFLQSGPGQPPLAGFWLEQIDAQGNQGFVGQPSNLSREPVLRNVAAYEAEQLDQGVAQFLHVRTGAGDSTASLLALGGDMPGSDILRFTSYRADGSSVTLGAVLDPRVISPDNNYGLLDLVREEPTILSRIRDFLQPGLAPSAAGPRMHLDVQEGAPGRYMNNAMVPQNPLPAGVVPAMAYNPDAAVQPGAFGARRQGVARAGRGGGIPGRGLVGTVGNGLAYVAQGFGNVVSNMYNGARAGLAARSERKAQERIENRAEARLKAEGKRVAAREAAAAKILEKTTTNAAKARAAEAKARGEADAARAKAARPGLWSKLGEGMNTYLAGRGEAAKARAEQPEAPGLFAGLGAYWKARGDARVADAEQPKAPGFFAGLGQMFASWGAGRADAARAQPAQPQQPVDPMAGVYEEAERMRQHAQPEPVVQPEEVVAEPEQSPLVEGLGRYVNRHAFDGPEPIDALFDDEQPQPVAEPLQPEPAPVQPAEPVAQTYNTLVAEVNDHLRSGNLKEAFGVYQKASRLDGLTSTQEAAIDYGVADIAFRLGKFDAAKPFVDKAVAAQTGNTNYVTLQRMIDEQLASVVGPVDDKDTVASEDVAGAIHQDLPRRVVRDDELQLADIVDEQEYDVDIEWNWDNEDPVGAIDDALEQSHEDFHRTGNAAFQEGDYRTAVQAFERALSSHPTSPGYLTSVVRAYVKLGDFDGALHHATELVSNDPDHPMSHYDFAQVLFGLGRFSAAEASVETALELDTNGFEVGVSGRQLLEQIAEAREAFQTAEGYVTEAADLREQATALAEEAEKLAGSATQQEYKTQTPEDDGQPEYEMEFLGKEPVDDADPDSGFPDFEDWLNSCDGPAEQPTPSRRTGLGARQAVDLKSLGGLSYEQPDDVVLTFDSSPAIAVPGSVDEAALDDAATSVYDAMPPGGPSDPGDIAAAAREARATRRPRRGHTALTPLQGEPGPGDRPPGQYGGAVTGRVFVRDPEAPNRAARPGNVAVHRIPSLDDTDSGLDAVVEEDATEFGADQVTEDLDYRPLTSEPTGLYARWHSLSEWFIDLGLEDLEEEHQEACNDARDVLVGAAVEHVYKKGLGIVGRQRFVTIGDTVFKETKGRYERVDALPTKRKVSEGPVDSPMKAQTALYQGLNATNATNIDFTRFRELLQ